MGCLQTTERVSGNIFIRPSGVLERGESRRGHKHNFDHTTIVFTGAVLVRATTPAGEEAEKEFKAPDSFLVKAEVEHEITATEAGTCYWCVYSHRTPQGEVSEEYTGWTDAYR